MYLYHKSFFPFFVLILLFITCDKPLEQRNAHYITNQSPLVVRPYTELPLGSIQPSGWLHHQLTLMRDGMTGNLDKLYEKVIGPRNGWLGGDGDGWERGPYWLDGLVPLAYILKDEDLIKKTKPWIEWSLKNQAADGYFGPVPFDEPPEREEGIQRGPRRDWWPKMVMLKVLQQYYNASGDQRVIDLMTRYFRYQLENLPDTPLNHWSFWGNRRGGDNLLVVYWLYNITKESFLLELAELITEQTFPWTDHFSQGKTQEKFSSHCVNLAQGIKQPIIYYQQHPDGKYTQAVKKAFADIKKYHGQPQGMYGGDEAMHGNDPTRGSEFCSAIELMYSLENMVQITGDVQFADHLEKVTFNALPTQVTDDFSGRQYFQSANQVKLTRVRKNFSTEHGGADLCYGMLTGYPCCTCNMHQGWPKFVQNLWYATADNGLAALVYSSSSVSAKVADGEWSLNEESLDQAGGDRRMTPTKMSILQKDKDIRIERVYERVDEDDFVLREDLTLDGEDSESSILTGTKVSSATWSEDQKNILINSTLYFEWEDNEIEFDVSEKMMLDVQSKKLSIDFNFQTPQGDREGTLVYDKSE